MSKKRFLVYFCILMMMCFCFFSCNSSSDTTSWTKKGKPVLTEVSFPESPEAVNALTETAITSAGEQLNMIKTASPRTFENTIVAFDRLLYDGFKRLNTLQTLSFLSPDEEIRQAADNGMLNIAGWFFMTMNDPSFLDMMAEFDGSGSSLNVEDQALLDRTLADLKIYGLGKTEEERGALQTANLTIETLKRTILSNITNGAPDGNNPPVLANLVRARSAFASLLGFSSFGAFINSQRMAGTPETAITFLRNASDRIAPAFASEVGRYLELKIRETGNPADAIDFSDIGKYQTQSIEERYGISDIYSEDLFELENSLNTLFLIADKVFGIRISPSDPPGPVWHDDVRYYIATDVATGKPLGSFYMDLFEREGKNGSPKITPLSDAQLNPDGTWGRPLFVLIFDCIRPVNGGAVFLSMDKAESLFHEFGHALQRLCSTCIYNATSPAVWGFDFVETHSQFLEQWLSDPAVLAHMFGGASGFTSEDLARRNAAKQALSIVEAQFYIAHSMTDLTLYTRYGASDSIDPVAVYNDALSEYFVPYAGNTTHVRPLSHMADNMPAQYYCYLWSKAIAQDLASRFRASEKGFMDPELGMEMRREFFEFDASRKPETAIRSFLGRDWNTGAFFHSLGVE